jgi:hypothetical protein
MLKYLILYCLWSLQLIVSAQTDSIKKVPYSPEFKFKEGIYFDFNQVKNNSPVAKSRIITNADPEDNNFFDIVLEKKVISYYDDLGMKRDVNVKSIWGYSKNGAIYLRMNETYNRISYIGSICHFTANITVYQPSYYDPYYYNPNYYYRNWNTGRQSTASEMRQFVMDFETGKILEYEENNLELLFMRDPSLHDEYAALSKKKKDQMKFFYIRKFNERNPLMIPN